MADALVDVTPDWGVLLERALTGAMAAEETPLHDTARSEAFFLSLHFLDRIALANLAFADRELYMNALLNHLGTRFSLDQLRAGYSAVQSSYGSYKLVPEEGETPKGTLFWEIGKALAAEHAGMNPVAVTLTVKVTTDIFTALLQTFRALQGEQAR